MGISLAAIARGEHPSTYRPAQFRAASSQSLRDRARPYFFGPSSRLRAASYPQQRTSDAPAPQLPTHRWYCTARRPERHSACGPTDDHGSGCVAAQLNKASWRCRNRPFSARAGKREPPPKETSRRLESVGLHPKTECCLALVRPGARRAHFTRHLRRPEWICSVAIGGWRAAALSGAVAPVRVGRLVVPCWNALRSVSSLRPVLGDFSSAPPAPATVCLGGDLRRHHVRRVSHRR